jgi:hypothetical protein
MRSGLGGNREMFCWLYCLLFGKRVLRGREADFSLCRVPGVDESTTARAIQIVGAAFMIPKLQWYCLRPDDTLRSLYLDGAKRRWGDDMDYEHLFLDLDAALGRDLSEEEMNRILTVGDVIRLMGSQGPP